jgi:hypothetical protein
MYAGLALVCLVQAVYPTLLGWLCVVIIYSVFVGLYIYGDYP